MNHFKEKTRNSAPFPQTWLQIAQLRAEKCELREAKTGYFLALQQAKKTKDSKSTMEAIAGLLRLAGEALDEESIEKWDKELGSLMKGHPGQIPPMAFYCRGAVARHRREFMLAQRHFHRYLRAARQESKSEEAVVRGWAMLAVLLQQRGRSQRSEWLAFQILKRYEALNLRGINGILYLLLGTIEETKKNLRAAMKWYQKANAQFLGDHNWYYLLYVLYGYARIERKRHRYSQARWYLDLIDKAVSNPEFGSLRREVAAERERLAQDAVDLLIDSRKGWIKTREGGTVSLRKQYVLIQILEALSHAHERTGQDRERGLSKAELIQTVWKEDYSPHIHDNKLYYNINRLRKLIEPNIRKPQYLLNWKEGYRLAPGLRVQCISERRE